MRSNTKKTRKYANLFWLSLSLSPFLCGGSCSDTPPISAAGPGNAPVPSGNLEIWISPELDIMYGGGNTAAVRGRFTGGNPPIRAVRINSKIQGKSNAFQHNVDISRKTVNPAGQTNVIGWHNGNSLENVMFQVPFTNLYGTYPKALKQNILQFLIMHEICHFWFSDVSTGNNVMTGNVDLILPMLEKNQFPKLSAAQAQTISDSIRHP